MSEPGDVAAAEARLAAAADAIVTGVAELLPGYLLRESTRVLDAWPLVTSKEQPVVAARLADAVQTATERVVSELRALYALDPELQVATPLEIVRSSVREPTEVLRSAGVADVVRDEFDERAWPDDRFGLVPRAFADLASGGDDALGPHGLAWGTALYAILRARSGHT